MSGTFILGRGVACALGVGEAACVAQLQSGHVSMERIQHTPEFGWPYFAIPDSDTLPPRSDWHTRAQALVRHVIDACDTDIDRDAPLFIASSSLNVGGLERGVPFLPDQQSFVDDVAAWLTWRGPVFSVTSACTSALTAVKSAQALIESGLHEHTMVLGLELGNRYTSAGFSGMQLLANDRPRPLDATRDGLVLGEAVAALYLGTHPSRWRVLGGANCVNGANPVGADRDVAAHMIAQALHDCDIAPAQIDLIKLQAAGSPQNDAEEIAALHQVFSTLPPLLSLKSVIGHTLGASGTAELALLLACIEANVWPAAGPETRDPQLDAACNTELPTSPAYILANILGFGGVHSCVVLQDTTHE